MFIYYYVHLEQGFDETERRLVDLLSSLDGIASDAYRDGEVLRMRLGIDRRPIVAKTVEIRVGTPRFGTSETDIPITWKATGRPGLFPSMTADLVVASLGPELTHLALRGSYEPPLGSSGRSLDRTMLHRVAEASVKMLIDRIARSIEGRVDQVHHRTG